MTKPITAAAAMILVEECRLRLDDPVDEFLPELAHRKVLSPLDAPLESGLPPPSPSEWDRRAATPSILPEGAEASMRWNVIRIVHRFRSAVVSRPGIDIAGALSGRPP